MRIFTFIVLLTFLLSCCGCGDGGNVPAELRNLCPASITVKNGDKPMAGIHVILTGKTGQGAYACNGITDDKGVTRIRSTRGSFTRKGAPPGTYAVVLSEPIEVPADLLSQESDRDLPSAAQAEKKRKLDKFLSENQVVPAILMTASTSPIELVVAKGQDATVSIDVAKHR